MQASGWMEAAAHSIHMSSKGEGFSLMINLSQQHRQHQTPSDCSSSAANSQTRCCGLAAWAVPAPWERQQEVSALLSPAGLEQTKEPCQWKALCFSEHLVIGECCMSIFSHCWEAATCM